MNWEALGAVGDFIGGLAVIVTLIYLATQVQQARRLLQTSVVLGRAAASREINGLRVQDPALASLEFQVRASDGIAPPETTVFMAELGCTEAEAMQLSTWRYIAIRAIETGFMTEGKSERSSVSIQSVIRTKLDRLWWNHSSSMFTKDFSAYVNEVLLEEKDA